MLGALLHSQTTCLPQRLRAFDGSCLLEEGLACVLHAVLRGSRSLPLQIAQVALHCGSLGVFRWCSRVAIACEWLPA